MMVALVTAVIQTTRVALITGSTDNTGSTGGSGNNSGGSNNTGHGNGNVIVVQWGAAGCQIGWKCSDFSS